VLEAGVDEAHVGPAVLRRQRDGDEAGAGRVTMRIDAPVDDLFDLMADPATEESWNPNALEVRRIGQGPVGPGAEWQGRYNGMGSMRITLDGCERPTRLVFSISGSRMDMRWVFAFTPDGTGTRLVAEAELRPRGAMRLRSPLLVSLMRRTLRPAPRAARSGRRGASRPATEVAEQLSRL